jgi:hypothetical protein
LAGSGRIFGFPRRRLGLFPCPVSLSYQAIRTVAAARFLGRSKQAYWFVLLYDERNPFFCRSGDWPGWPAVLHRILRDHEDRGFYFRAISWQALVPKLPLTPAVRVWAATKHRL